MCVHVAGWRLFCRRKEVAFPPVLPIKSAWSMLTRCAPLFLVRVQHMLAVMVRAHVRPVTRGQFPIPAALPLIVLNARLLSGPALEMETRVHRFLVRAQHMLVVLARAHVPLVTRGR